MSKVVGPLNTSKNCENGRDLKQSWMLNSDVTLSELNKKMTKSIKSSCAQVRYSSIQITRATKY